jgi:hypothetical protein
MRTDSNSPPSPQTTSDEEWRRTFIIAVNQLAAGNIDHHQVVEWAIQAEALHGQRNPVEVAHEEWVSGKRSIPN